MGLFGKKKPESKPAQAPQKQAEKPSANPAAAHPVTVLPKSAVQPIKRVSQEPPKPIDEDTARAAAQALREYLQGKQK